MHVYHYSTAPRSELLTKRAQGLPPHEIAKAEQHTKRLGLVAPYIDHISFFIDPIPSKLLAEIYGGDHQAWRKGNILFEHIVDVAALGDDILFELVESVNKTKFLDEFSIKHNWVADNPETLKLWLKEIAEKSKAWGEVGRGLPALTKQIALNQNKLHDYFKAASERPDFEDGKMRYASNVPHLMVYPKSGKVAVEKVNRVTVGSNTRTPVLPYVPSSHRW